MTTIPDEILEQMASSEDVRVRSIGVIGEFLRHEFPGLPRPDDIAKRLIKTMTDADLLTFMGADLKVFLREARRSD